MGRRNKWEKEIGVGRKKGWLYFYACYITGKRENRASD